MKYLKNIVFYVGLLLFISGCSSKGIEFTPNFNSINELKDSDLKTMAVQKNHFSSAEAQAKAVLVGRGTNKMLSPYGGSFQEYLEISLKEELMQASLYYESSDIKIVTELLSNKLNTGMSTGTADLSANFKIVMREKEVFNKNYTIHHEWESSFAAATAIPSTLENYPIAMQKLIDAFLFDKEVIALLHK
ncbi:MAG: hypothetical protein EOM50_21250 [Erysipelotrichia bacterium]|nr:hypothetical protein [Erysipelotrichia bacterium]